MKKIPKSLIKGRLLGISLCLPIVPSYAQSVADITLLDANAQFVILELTIPEPVISETKLSGKMYQAISIPGTGSTNEPGSPSVPFRGVFIAVPGNSQTQLEILESDTETRFGYRLPPVNPSDARRYQDDRFLPASPAQMGMIGKIRVQKVAQVQFFPVRHNPVQQTIELYKRLRVKVNFINSTGSVKTRQPVVEESPVFDRMLQRLLINDMTRKRVLRRSRTADCPAPLPAIKLSIDKTGLYALSYAEIIQAMAEKLGKLDIPGLPAHELEMINQGESVAIFIAGGEDGVFGPTDVWYFYALAADTHYTRDNIYWLSLNPDGGLRVQVRDGSPDVAQTEFTQRAHIEENLTYWAEMPDSEYKDRFFWSQLEAGQSQEIPVMLHNLAPSAANATIQVMLQGKANNRQNPNHHTKVLLNGVEISDAQWEGQTAFWHEITVPQSHLRAGENVITLVSMAQSAEIEENNGDKSSLYVNWAQIDYTATATNPVLTAFKRSVHVEQNRIYWERMPKSIGKDHLFWGQVALGKSLEIPVNVPHLAPTAANATVRVMLQGKTDERNFNPDHHTKILLNGVEISDAQWNGQEVFMQGVTIPQTHLLEGPNTITLVSVGDTGAKADTILVNWAEIDYLATTTAEQDQLKFGTSVSGQYQLTVTGFSRPEVLVLDVTEPRRVVPLLGAAVQAEGVGGYQVQYADNNFNADLDKAYYAFSLTENNLLKPAEISLDLPTTRLKSSCHQADYFIIHHGSFEVTAFQQLIAARGLQVMAVPVSDIYDEFNHGLIDPQAIKDFLTYAYENYGGTREYVVLVGDANQDTLNELGHGINYVPTHTFHTPLAGETASDNWFVSISGDDRLPDMFLGRMPVRTQAELDAVVNKVASYPQSPRGDWQRNALFVTDNEKAFDDASDKLIEAHFADYNPQRVYLRQYTGDRGTIQAAAKQDVIDHINAGAILTNYTGHGSVSNWAGEFIFDSRDVALLDNPDNLTFVLALNCFNGQFSYFKNFYGSDDSLAEAFLKADGKGAIAMWAPTTLGYTYQHEKLADELFKRLLQEKETELGPLTTGVKVDAVNYIGINNVETFTLFGDPNTRLLLE